MKYITNKEGSLLAQGVPKRTSKVYNQTCHKESKTKTN